MKTSVRKLITSIISTALIFTIAFSALAVIPSSQANAATLSQATLNIDGKELVQKIVDKSFSKMIEIACKENPMGAIIGAAGLGAFETLLGGLDDDSPDAQSQQLGEILEQVQDISNKMDKYHTQEMFSLDQITKLIKELDSKVELSPFESEYDSMHNKLIRFCEMLDNNKENITTKVQSEKYPVITEDTYLAYDSILNQLNGNDDFSSIFESMKTFVNGTAAQSHGHPFFNIIADSAKLSLKNHPDQFLNTVTDADGFSELPSTTQIRNEIDTYEADMVLFYSACLQVQSMSYDRDNYKYNLKNIQEGNSYKALSQSPYTSEITKLTEKMKNMDEKYREACDYLENKVTEASVSIEIRKDGADTQKISAGFIDPAQAWVAANTLQDWDFGKANHIYITYDLNADWTADDLYGMAGSDILAKSNDFSSHDDISRSTLVCNINSYKFINQKLKDFMDKKTDTVDLATDFNFTINLNGHKIDARNIYNKSNYQGAIITDDILMGTLTINGDSQRDSSILGSQRVLKTGGFLSPVCHITFNDVKINAPSSEKESMFTFLNPNAKNNTFTLSNCAILSNSKNIFESTFYYNLSVSDTLFKGTGASNLKELLVTKNHNTPNIEQQDNLTFK